MRRLPAFLGALAVIAGAVAAPGPAAAAPDSSTPAEELATTTPIKHFLVLMQENHSFDNYFGTYPGADGIPEDTCMPVDNSRDPSRPATTDACVEPFHIEGEAILDLGHSGGVHNAQYNNGRMDGFIKVFNDRRGVGNQAMGHYDDRDIPYYWNVADNYVLFDRLFTSAAGGSVWNHMFWTTGTPGNPAADLLLPTGFDHVPTIFDRLQEAGISWKFYVQNYRPEITFRTPGTGDDASQIVWVPPLNYNRFLDDPALSSRIVDMSEYHRDLADGTLPAVSFMVPAGASEHPPGSIQAGERFVRSLLNALMASSSWNSSAFMWTYDDWGGWYDHVAPPVVDQYGYGFRSPALLVSPYAKKGHVDHTTLDFTSELKFIQNNWGVAPLGDRDRAANDITTAFDFSAGPREPVLLDRSREPEQLPATNSGVVYLCYGAALLAAPLAAVGIQRRRRARPEDRP
jgi:phospholipase C